MLLVVSGYAHRVDGLVTGLASSNAISGGAQTGAMNILLMGLESRTDYQGNTLSSALLTAMHAGSVYGVNNEGVGGQDTNTLILIHIFAGGQRAVGFSIPRDDWVTYPQAVRRPVAGEDRPGLRPGLRAVLNQTVSSSMSQSQRYFLANEAGQKATIDTVEAVTDQKIDHFAEVNLAGFFYLAQSFGGIEVCVKSWDGPTARAPTCTTRTRASTRPTAQRGGSQYLHLAADQALAFVRERDNLPNGDLDRTHRQQAVLDYVIWKLKTEGVLTDVGQLTSLLGTADKYLITDSSWNLLDFSTQMHALSGENLKFYTAPILGYETVDGQDANQIDVPAIQAAIKAKFTAPAPSPGGKAASKPAKKAAPIPAASTVTVDVYNGGSTGGLAGRSRPRWSRRATGPAPSPTRRRSRRPVKTGDEVFYGAGASANAAKIAGYFGVTATALASLPAGHVEVLLGSGSAIVPSGLAAGRQPGGDALGRLDLDLAGGQRRRRQRGNRHREREIRNTLRLLTNVHILRLVFQLHVLTPQEEQRCSRRASCG